MIIDAIKKWYWKWIYTYRLYELRKNNKVIIEFHAAEHCNLSCSSCSHYSPLAKPKFCDLDKLKKSLIKLSRFQDTIEKIRVLGGEPLLNPQICEIFELVHQCCPEVEIEIITNGILIPKMKPEFFECCRRYDVMVAVTQYPLKSGLYQNIEDVLTNEAIRHEISSLESTVHKWNRIKLKKTSFPTLKSKIKFLKKSQCTRCCIQLVDDKLFPCNVNAHVHHLNDKFGTKFIHRKGDYMKIDDIKNSKDIRKLLYKTPPFCMYHRNRFNHYDWQPSRLKKEEWLF